MIVNFSELNNIINKFPKMLLDKKIFIPCHHVTHFVFFSIKTVYRQM